MSSSVQDHWSSKVPGSMAKGRSSGWAAFDLKQQGKQVLKDELDFDPYPPIKNIVTSIPIPKYPVTSTIPTMRSFTSVVQPTIDFPLLIRKGDCSNKQSVIAEASNSNSRSENKTETKNKTSPLETLKELHSWADEGLIEDILTAVNGDIDQAVSLLKSMKSSGCSEESKTKNNEAHRSPVENLHTNKETVQTGYVPSNDVTHIPKLRSVSDGCILSTVTEKSEDGYLRSTQSDGTTHMQLNLHHIVTAPVEPEWEEDDIYLCHRKDAIRAIRSASQHSRAANNAFMRGDRISAHNLSLKAREEWMAAEKLNAKAAEEILRIRNNGNNIWKLDLHGLHSSEAVHALQNHLWKIEAQIPLRMATKSVEKQGTAMQRPAVLQVVTGTGNHSRGEASLPRAVRGFLIGNGYRFDEARPGVLEVRPKFRH